MENLSEKILFKVKEQVHQATTSALVSDISSILRGNIKFPFAISIKKEKNILVVK